LNRLRFKIRIIFYFIIGGLFCLNTTAQLPFIDSNLPIFIINTNGQNIPDDPKITAHLGIIDNGVERNSLTDPFNDYDGQIAIELRGSTSQELFDKKSFGFETQLEDGSNNNVSILGFPEENDWVLQGPFSDKTYLRNALAYRFARQTGQYASRNRFCEVILNGAYKGVYLLLEKIKQDKNRVDIADLLPTDVTGDELTGGYILKIDKLTGAVATSWISNYPPLVGSWQTTLFQVHYPKAENLKQAQLGYIKNYISDFEDMLMSSSFDDPDMGYEAWIDVQSFIDFIIVNELTKNVDAYRLSTFFYKEKDSNGGKIKMGPAWDFNIAMGNGNYCDGWNPEGLSMDFNSRCSQDFWIVHFWWKKLISEEKFGHLLSQRWKNYRASIFSQESIYEAIDSMSQLLAEAERRDHQLYPIIGEFVWPNEFIGNSYNEEIDYLKGWFAQRLTFLDSAFERFDTSSTNSNVNSIPIVFPNPFTEELTVERETISRNVILLTLYDSQGKLIKGNRLVAQGAGTHKWKVPTDGLASGIYFYKIEQSGELLDSGKLIKNSN